MRLALALLDDPVKLLDATPVKRYGVELLASGLWYN